MRGMSVPPLILTSVVRGAQWTTQGVGVSDKLIVPIDLVERRAYFKSSTSSYACLWMPRSGVFSVSW